MSYLDPRQPRPDGSPARKRTQLVMAGGELLIDGVREELFYPALDAVAARWGVGAPHISEQTTGDISALKAGSKSISGPPSPHFRRCTSGAHLVHRTLYNDVAVVRLADDRLPQNP